MGIVVVDRGTGAGSSQSAFVLTQGRLDVYANGTYCTTIAIGPSYRGEETALASVFVGTEGQPDPCREDGARLTFVDGTGTLLAEMRTLKSGTTTVLDAFGGPPPPDGLPITGSGGLAADRAPR